MANIVDASYYIEGNEETIDLVYNALTKNKSQDGVSLGCILRDCGIDIEKLHGAEWVFSYHRMKPNVVYISTESRWWPSNFSEMLEEHFKDLRVYYQVCDTESCCLPETNDIEGKYFKRYMCTTYSNLDDRLGIGCESFSTLEEVFVFLKEHTNFISTMEDVRKYNDLYKDKTAKIVIVDKCSVENLSK
ncbi:MAG: hypothetical protein IK117_07960 [Bacteroidales bacterium]|nr:hypothetical protein [Bacteroidales bacterium]